MAGSGEGTLELCANIGVDAVEKLPLLFGQIGRRNRGASHG
jgi:hypothetical protein